MNSSFITLIILFISTISYTQIVSITDLGSNVDLTGTQVNYNNESGSFSIEIVLHNISGSLQNFDVIRNKDSLNSRWHDASYIVSEMDGLNPDGWVFIGDGYPGNNMNPYDTGFPISLGDEDSLKIRINYVEIDSIPGLCTLFTCYVEDAGIVVDSISFQICAGQVEVDEISTEEGIKIYPNPASNEINFSGLKNVDSEVKLISMSGKCVLITRLTAASSSISLDEVGDGIYSVELSNSKGLISRRKIIVQK
ncbi:MAG: hypothetical protein ACI837_000088 [Crocinitomicaceae bacterium]|jgi:hypothetical protein